MKKEILIILICLVLLSISVGCEKNSQATLIDQCIEACKNALNAGENLAHGPCLLDPMADPKWVCDIAHKPRQEIDNLPENQCKAWHNGTAIHFIELTPECELIRVV